MLDDASSINPNTNPASVVPQVVELAHYTKTDLHNISGGDADPFGVAQAGLMWLSKERHFGIRSGNRLVAHAGLVVVPVAVGDTHIDVAGLGGVIVAPDLRGRGLARLVVAAAMEHAQETGLEFGLLFCRPDRLPLYRRMGWVPLDGDIHVEQPTGSVHMPLRGMWTPLRDGARWPSGPVHVLSLPM
ncbi:GNAT family N-acetyltransferase [Streptomyces sp. NPDC001165]|uniref:GNAT family N-acetyltransferase n=1 Tax=Streptomyces sp. NPDC001165 TaxID=3364546 RepID=UPI0036BDA127